MEDFHCSFCGKRRLEVRKLISGPRVFICNECVVRCREVIGPLPAADTARGLGGELERELERTTAEMSAPAFTDEEDVTVETRPPDEHHCSFCSRLKTDVAKLVTGPTAYICDECIALCEDVIADDLAANPPEA